MVRAGTFPAANIMTSSCSTCFWKCLMSANIVRKKFLSILKVLLPLVANSRDKELPIKPEDPNMMNFT